MWQHRWATEDMGRFCQSIYIQKRVFIRGTRYSMKRWMLEHPVVMLITILLSVGPSKYNSGSGAQHDNTVQKIRTKLLTTCCYTVPVCKHTVEY